ncbi:hypothetical protein FNV43_RR25418 [Rhamnella rubrinervis]|uniref:Uncharacterized protein n=1 Tax=Rhamnella rubrinervis TaxID=2594499 RepID=A0A8K0DNJ7_9ROSA|nr:hypothetical protein FNV43_RR25418 [Rhamnella rubrinervis]
MVQISRNLRQYSISDFQAEKTLMEDSNPNLDTSDLSLNASDSQFLGPSYSLSLPSEPPELRNWFSSYEYESPALGYTDNFGCTISEEGEIAKDNLVNNEGTRGKEENLGGFMEIGEKQKMLVGEKLNSIGFEESTTSFVDDNQSLNKNKDCSYSPLLLSEPIDIRNWFSSYVYESPAFDTTEDFMHSVYKESKSKKDGFVIEDSNIGKEENFGQFMRSRSSDEKVVSEAESSRLGNCNDSWRQKKQPSNKAASRIEEGKENPSGTIEQSLKHQELQDKGTSSANDAKISSLDEEGPQCTTSLPNEIDSMPLNIQNSCSVAPKKLINRMESIQENSEMKGQTQAAGQLPPESALKSIDSEASMRKSTHGCSGKEEICKEIPSNGFVTTRKGRYSRANDENSPNVDQRENREGTVSLEGGKVLLAKRKALSERTNLHLSTGVEITGKWQCPQKKKPNHGPPSKQLRLERWVHRV